MDSILSTGIISALLASAIIFLGLKGWRWEDRASLGILPLAIPVLGGVFFVKSTIGAFSFFSAARLAPAIAIAYGYGLFSPIDDGPVLNTIYGPIAYLVYLPAALAETPAGALLTAGLIKTAFYFIPLFMLIMSSTGRDRTRSSWIAVTLACCLIVAVTFALGATNYMATEIHSDAPSLGLGMLSCLLLMKANARKDVGSLFWPGLLAASAVWVKQTEAPLILAQFVFLLMVRDWKVALRYGAITSIAGLIMGMLFIGAFGFGPIWLNMFFIPSQHAIDNRIGQALITLLVNYSLFFPFLIFAGLTAKKRSVDGILSSVSSENWFLPSLVAIFLIPTSLLGYLKVGGWVNSFHGLYYLLGAAGAVLANVQWADRSSRWLQMQRWILVLVLATLTLRVFPLIQQYPAAVQTLQGNNPSQHAYRYAMRQPGEVYFPWLPLSSLMADSKLYHFDFGLRDRQNAGIMTSFVHFRAYLPERMKYVAMPAGGDYYSDIFTLPDEDFFFLNYIQRFEPVAEVELPGLENFRVIRIQSQAN